MDNLGGNECMNELLEKKSKASALKKILPWFENIFLGLLSLWISNKILLNFDIRILYIMVMGLMYGVKHSIFSSALSISLICYFYHSQNMFGSEVNIKVFELFISFILIAIISGLSKTNTNLEIKVIRDAYNRLERLNHKAEKDLTDAKRAVVVLTEQLKTSQQSYGSLYKIIKKLEGLESEEVLEKVPEVVKELTGIDSSVLYIVKGGGDVVQLFRPEALTNEGIPSPAIFIIDEEIIRQVVHNQRAYINSKMKKGVPDAAIPIKNINSGIICGVIAISNIPFQKMSEYTLQMLNFTGELISDYLTKSMVKNPKPIYPISGN